MWVSRLASSMDLPCLRRASRRPGPMPVRRTTRPSVSAARGFGEGPILPPLVAASAMGDRLRSWGSIQYGHVSLLQVGSGHEPLVTAGENQDEPLAAPDHE